MALTRLKHSSRYQDGFTPRLINEELKRRFHPGEFILVGYMGDISFATKEEIGFILADTIEVFPETNFLFCTKNPAIYSTWGLIYPSAPSTLPENLYLGTTIESNIDHKLSKSPIPWDRYVVMANLDHSHKFVSIEPILDFDMNMMVLMMRNIKPEIVEVGYDNYGNRLPEPPLDKTLELITRLERFTTVKKKTIRTAWNETNL
jgi:hypothetical protein